MRFLDALARPVLLLSILFLPACATLQQPHHKPAIAPPIPSYGGPRRVAVSITEQKLRAYDGGQLIFETHVSTGHEGKHTPTGSFRVLDKELIHYSTLYDNAPMPFSVRFHGNYFLHGFSVVPDYPASHGCIRLPLRDGDYNRAQQFYEWVRYGTPIVVSGKWLNEPRNVDDRPRPALFLPQLPAWMRGER